MTKSTLAISAVLAAAAFPSAAGAAWERPLIVSGPAGRGAGPEVTAAAPVGVVALDSLVYRHTRADYGDLRVYGPGSRALGTKMLPAIRDEIRCSPEPVSLRRLRAEIRGDSVFEAVFLAEDSARIPDRVSVAIDARDFEVSLSVWTAPSADPSGAQPGKWIPRLQDVSLFDYSRFLDWRRESAEWRAGADRAVRIRIGGLTRNRRSVLSTLSGKIGNPDAETVEMAREPLRVESIAFGRDACRAVSDGPIRDTVDLAFRTSARIAEPGSKRTWYLFEGGRYPLEALLPGVAPGNFLRRAVLAGLEDTGSMPLDMPWDWPRLGESALHRIDWGARADSSLRMPLAAEGRYAILALGVQDNDDPPLDLVRARAEVRRMLLYFPAGRGDSLALRYGDADARPLESEFASMLERGGNAPRAEYRLGPERPAPGGQASRPRPDARIADWLLKAGFGLAALALMALLAWTAKKAGKAGS